MTNYAALIKEIRVIGYEEKKVYGIEDGMSTPNCSREEKCALIVNSVLNTLNIASVTALS